MNIDWDISENLVDSFVTCINDYLTDSITNEDKDKDELICNKIVNYYILNNPVDGAIAELLCKSVYSLFADNDSLCVLLDAYMTDNFVSNDLKDTIWMRVTSNILSIIIMENEVGNDINKEKHFSYMYKHGYFLDNIEDYQSYSVYY